MKLEYKSIKEDSYLVLTNFNCEPSQNILADKDLFKIIWCQEDSVTVEIDGYQIVLQQQELLFCTPSNLLKVPQTTKLLALVFNREFYCIRDHDREVSCHGLLFYGSSEPPILKLSEKYQKSIKNMFTILKEEFETKDQIQGEMLRVLLKRLLITSSRLIKANLPEPEISNSQIDIVRQYNILVEQHFKTKHKVSEYAQLLFKSPKTLSNLFRKMGDKSPLKIINERIALEAKRLLLASDKTTEEIAYDLGYKEAGHFSKFFKTQTGSTPAAFKKSKKRTKV
ncbi:helix-turn-helix domain-containing protein [Aquimarina sp. ERC-38]|uniref:helix-turn-helix domain-containing protein n=1 Tax=Aquimarina sp. ERC-38 TaxID=2949996 RepID=UPI0022468C7C|nr:helix-turn-helix domain-containing protein [Aquimarina sp. ERC-38]UZO79257.1 helix-turn-helix domain-containing protein [Aquimarina sp. ERC-38]